MHTGFWSDAAERALHTVIGTGVVTSILHAIDQWLASGQTIDWHHYLVMVVAPLGSLAVSLIGSRLGDGSARLGTTHPVTPDGIGGREMTHDEVEAHTGDDTP